MSMQWSFGECQCWRETPASEEGEHRDSRAEVDFAVRLLANVFSISHFLQHDEECIIHYSQRAATCLWLSCLLPPFHPLSRLSFF